MTFFENLFPPKKDITDIRDISTNKRDISSKKRDISFREEL